MLLVSSRSEDRTDLQRITENSLWDLYVLSTWRDGLTFLRKNQTGVVICDAQLETTDWRRIISDSADLPCKPCVIICSRLADERLWAEVLNLGGYDVLCTPFDAEEVLRVSLQAVQFWQRENGKAFELAGAFTA